jgi:signal transduction histidine kinase
MPVFLHPQEEKRIEELEALDILDTVSEQSYDDLVALASSICDTPVALLSLVDGERQWFKARVGLDALQTPREHAFCSHAILQDGPFLVPDPLNDPRFADNPLVLGEPHVGFYAGVPVYSRGMPLGTLCVIDHEPRELSEDKLKSLHQLARQVERMFSLRLQVAALRRTQTMQDEFISMINHELRTPLTSILGTLSLLSSGYVDALPGNAVDLLSIAKRNSDRLHEIINDVLDTSALGAGQFKHCPEPFDLFSCVQQHLLLAKSGAEKKGRKLVLVSSCPESMVFADPGRVGQVLQNYLSNAIKYSDADSTIRVELTREGEHCKVTVYNEGPGIAPEELPLMFQRFFRSRIKHPGNPPGTGLGLYICQQIMKLSGGEVGCDSELGDYTSFWFTLPLFREETSSDW